MALKGDGKVVGWGHNGRSQTTNQSGLTGLIAVAEGWIHTVALRGDGTMVAWGYNGYDQARVPDGLTDVAAVDAGGNHTVALKRDGNLIAWGDNNYSQMDVPAGLIGVIAVAVGGHHTVALKNDGTVVAWGTDWAGETTVPAGLTDVVAIGAGGVHTVALKRNGKVVAWGANSEGQTDVPTELSEVIAITAGAAHTVALKRDGTLVAWGRSTEGQTAVPSDLSNVVAIAAGDYHTVALKNDGSVVAWGRNNEGQTTIQAGMSDAIAVAAGSYSTIVIRRVTYAPPPTITAIGASSGIVGSVVTVSGTHFTRVIAVRVAGHIARWTVDSPTQLRVTLPAIDAIGPVEVVTVTGRVTSSASVDVAMCSMSAQGACDAHASCQTGTSGRATCACDLGWQGDGARCLEVDECAEGTDTCDAHASCTNTQGSFTCACEAGYRGDGHTCSDIDECAEGTDTCDANALCTNTPGAYGCACESGWEGDGRSCADVDECALGTADCPSPMVCSNVPGGFACSCPTGTVDDGGGCASVLEDYAYIPGGTFVMGSPEGETGRVSNETQHTVTLTRPFWMATTEVTQGEWSARMGANPSDLRPSADKPVESVGWTSALSFANARSTAEGLPACYTLAGCSGSAALGTLTCSSVAFDGVACSGYRLPTESEWEYAARAGTTTATYAGNPTSAGCSDSALSQIAWYCGNVFDVNHVVGTRAPNAFGLYDMLGNLWEWTWDAFDTYPTTASHDPTGGVAGERVLRGGSSLDNAAVVRAAFRLHADPGGLVGFRLVRNVACPEGTALDATGQCVSTLDGYAYLPRGTFTMGSPFTEGERDADEIEHAVTLSHSFWLGKTEVTQGEWRALMESNPSAFQGGAYADADNRPVEQVSWWDAIAYANAASNAAGLPGCYVPLGCSGWPGSSYECESVSMVPGCTGYRLPTEAEWEYAARAGLTGRRYGTNTNHIAWTASNATGETHAVAALEANARGLSDMLGNVMEWTGDWYGAYGVDAVTDPQGPSTGVERVLRGEAWNQFDFLVRFASRITVGGPGYRSSDVGFRLARTVECPVGVTGVVDGCQRPAVEVVGWGSAVVNAEPLIGAKAIAVGGQHTVALKGDGSVVAWGNNGDGQATVPVGLNNVVAVAAGGYHTVALKGDGTVVAWGSVGGAQTTVPGNLSGVVAIAAGEYHTVALKGDGTVVAWGANDYGQTTVPGNLSGVVAIAAGAYHTVALQGDGAVVAWGYNSKGQATVPSNLSGVVNIAAGYDHTVALKGDGTVVAWGSNGYGQATVGNLSGVVAIAAGFSKTVALKGDGTLVARGYNGNGQSEVPTGLNSVVAVAAGNAHTVTLNGNGTVIAWGNNYYGQATVPGNLSGVVAAAAGAFHTVALKSNGIVIAWGDNYYGQATVPAGITGVVAVAAGAYHTVALKGDGTVVAWGYNDYGQTTVPAGLSGVVAVAAGAYHTVALKGDGTVVAWGHNYYGQTTVPAGLSGVVAVEAGDYHTVALKGDGTVVAWGAGWYGQTSVPPGLNGVVAVAAGYYHSMALKADGTVVAWGRNDMGQTIVPQGLTNVLAIVVGGNQSLALRRPTLDAPAPTITDVALDGSSLDVTGTSFDKILAVRVDGRLAPWTRVSSTSLRAAIPNGAALARIDVITVTGGARHDL